VKNFLLTSR